MSQVSGVAFGYDAQSVAWLDGYIELQRVRTDATPQLVDGLVNVFGSYLGECVIECSGLWPSAGWGISGKVVTHEQLL